MSRFISEEARAERDAMAMGAERESATGGTAKRDAAIDALRNAETITGLPAAVETAAAAIGGGFAARKLSGGSTAATIAGVFAGFVGAGIAQAANLAGQVVDATATAGEAPPDASSGNGRRQGRKGKRRRRGGAVQQRMVQSKMALGAPLLVNPTANLALPDESFDPDEESG